MKFWKRRFRDDDDDDEEDDEGDQAYVAGTELPTLKGMNSTTSDEADESSDSRQQQRQQQQQHEDQQPHPYPLLTTPRKQRPGHLLRKQSTSEEPQTPMFQVVMDRIEDEVEVHAYDDLVPLEIKLALEDKVFGWTHLTSSVIGHILFTSGAYWLTFQFVTITMNRISMKISMSDWAPWVRSFLCLWAAVATFRMVRRRRHVWFRSAYGSKSYLQDAERRRQQVAEIDRTTALGRYVQSFKHRRVMSKLKKAETQFAKKHRRTQSEKLKLRANSLQTISTDGTNSMLLSPNSERQLLLERIDSDADYGSSGSDEDTEATSLMSPSSSPISSPLTKQHRRPSFNTKPTYRMHSIGHDEVLMEESIRVMPYAHGGFFGAAPFLLSNPHWISLLRHLMPDVYVEISRRVAVNPPSRLIHWAENNPVVAAYGAAHALEQNSSGRGLDGSADPHIPNLEWDVFLDPALVRRVQLVLDQHVEFERQKSASNRSKEQSEVIEAYYKKELERRSKQLVDKMLIAHGNILHLAVEQLGVWKAFNYSRVKRTRRTLGGGIYARQWMAVFAEALKLGVSHDIDDADISSPSKPKSHSSKKISSLSALTESACPDTTMEESVRLLERITASKQPLGLVLDIKSRHIPHHIWAIVVDTLRTAGIRVEGVASFCIDEIRDLSRFSTIGPIPSMIFCHSAGDLQRACHEGKINNGDMVFFNAGCLLDSNLPSGVTELLASFDPRIVKDSYRVEPCGLPRGHPQNVRSCLQDYKDCYNLSIGVYCQEFSIDETACQTLVKLVNQHSSLYDLGFSWGGINGITIKGIAPGRFTKTDGYWNQRHIGQFWDYDLYPRMSPQSISASRAAATNPID